MLLLISGPTCIGKDTVWVKTAENIGFTRVIPYTTRKKRTGEEDGECYKFIKKSTFEKLILDNKLIEWDYFNGNYYGTHASILELSNAKYRVKSPFDLSFVPSLHEV